MGGQVNGPGFSGDSCGSFSDSFVNKGKDRALTGGVPHSFESMRRKRRQHTDGEGIRDVQETAEGAGNEQTPREVYTGLPAHQGNTGKDRALRELHRSDVFLGQGDLDARLGLHRGNENEFPPPSAPTP